MAVQVAARVDVSEADSLSALDRGASIAEGIAQPSNTPVAVTVFNSSYPGHRLLAAAWCTSTTHTQLAAKQCKTLAQHNIYWVHK